MNMLKPAALALPLALISGAALGEDLHFMLSNGSSYDLMVFQTSPSGVDSWEEDVLADGYLPSGNQIPVVIADGRDYCFYDVRFQFDGANVLEVYEIDLCEYDGTEFTLFDNE